jgi:4-amino-4-deoxy-L-arabinose transferase-like glycosyltransferase
MLSISFLGIIIFYITKELFDIRIAYIAFLLSLVYSTLVSFAVSTYIRPLAMLFLYGSFYFFLITILKKKHKYVALAGIFAGLAILTRFEFVLYAFLLTGILLYYILNKTVTKKYVPLFIVPIIIIYAVYAIPLYKYTKFPGLSPYIANKVFSMTKVPTKPHHNFEQYQKVGLGMRNVLFNGNTAASINLRFQKKVKVSQKDWEKYGDIEVEKKVVSSNAKRFINRILPGLFEWHIIGFFLLGVFGCVYWRKKRSIPVFIILFVTLLVFPFFSAWSTRYYAHIIPCILIISAAGVYFIGKWLSERFRWRLLFYLTVGGVLGIYVANDIENIKTEYAKDEKLWLKCADYLKANSNKDDIVLARKGFPAFYSNLREATLPDEQNLQDVWEYADYIGADYLLIDNKVAASLMPQYKKLLERGTFPSNLELKKEFYKGTSYHTRIFKFKK